MGVERIWFVYTAGDGSTFRWRGRSGWVAEPGARGFCGERCF